MAVLELGLMLLLAMATHSDATYCVCNSGVSETILQSNIDYACANGADCSAINQNGACYNPNTIRDHCSYAVNSYYQRKGQVSGSCDFHGSATVTANAPTSAGSGCVYQASPSNGGTPTTPSTGGTPTTPSTGGTPNTGMGGTPNTGTGGTPNTGMGGAPNTGGTTNPGMVPGSTMSPPGFGLGPTGSGFGNTDGSDSVKLVSPSNTIVIITLLICGLMWQRI